ncbi:hypothetical protein BSZ07_00030 [Streptomyces sp. M1013]|uniref:hypothetical protein n=1 Tax=Streptomyces sp. M1013 TaxID=549798 RepID=UPI000978D767|nr:hypothetical protein [Streptomyces sp. M1013]OMI91340.1 hypothetical protein BSZ07_00030 [Streptomyces sp. M1013]
MTPREHEDGMRHEPTLSADEKADGFAAVMQRLQSHSPDARARLQTQAEAAALGHEAYALGQEHLERGDFEAARRWLRVAAGHHIPGAARALEEIALRQALDEFTDGAAVGGAHAPAGVVPCETIPSPLRPWTEDSQHRLGALAWASSVEQLYVDQAVAAARQQAGRITAQARREADAILAEARQQAECTAAACAEIVLDTERERAEAAALLAEVRQKAEGVQAEVAEIEAARRRAQETLTKAREQALLIIDDARKGAVQIRRKARRHVGGPEVAYTQYGRDFLRDVEEALKLTECMRPPGGSPVSGMYRGIVERSSRRLPVPLRPGQNALAGTVVLLVEGKDDTFSLRWMRVSQERDGHGCAGPESWSGLWQWLVIETAACGVSADAFERAGRAYGDVMLVRPDGAALFAIGVTNTDGDGDGGAEREVDGVRNPTSR